MSERLESNYMGLSLTTPCQSPGAPALFSLSLQGRRKAYLHRQGQACFDVHLKCAMHACMEVTSKTRFLIVILLTTLLSACATTKTMPIAKPGVPVITQVPAMSLVPGTSADMNTPGYWIGQHPDPDRQVMTYTEIAAFNAQTLKNDNSIADIATFNDTVSGEKLKAELSARLGFIKVSGYYLAGGKQPDKTWWKRLKDNLNLGAIESQVTVRFGLITGFSDQRALPLTQGLYRKDSNLSLDRLQENTLDIAAPVAVLHQSRDGLWLYVAAATTRGWVRADRVALCEHDILKDYIWSEKIAIVTAANADIFADENLRIFVGRVQMGAKLTVLEDSDAKKFRVLVPTRNQDGTCTMKAAYVQTSEARLGYLPYTPRAIINQAFKLLHTPYGWGGQFGEQDCSRFLQEVFATVGLILPRNSAQQALVGRLIYANPKKGAVGDKLTILSQHAIPALTILYMNGHIMLFLGFVDGKPYIIHDLWGYNIDKSTIAVVNRVVVTQINLGKGSSGSLLDKINTIRVLDTSSALPTATPDNQEIPISPG